MPKKPPASDSAGPMGMQPPSHGPTAATQMLPTMPCAAKEEREMKGETRRSPAAQKTPPTRAEAVRAARARITRRQSLRKQRDAQKS